MEDKLRSKMSINTLTKKHMEEINISRVEDIKKRTKPMDAYPLIKVMVEKKFKFTEEERQGFRSSISKASNEVGLMLLERCFIESVMTQEEYKNIVEKYNIDISDFGTILQAYFNRKDGLVPKDDEIIVVTMEYSNIFKHRDFIKKRFDVDIISCKEGIEKMEKIDKEVEQKLIQKSQ